MLELAQAQERELAQAQVLELELALELELEPRRPPESIPERYYLAVQITSSFSLESSI